MQGTGAAPLHDGRTVEIELIDTPDSRAHAVIPTLLGHKGEPWLWQIREWLEGRTPGLEMLYYVGAVEGVPAGCVANFRNAQFGNITHVYTVPGLRRLGIARLLLKRAIADFAQEKGRLLVLGARFEGMPWHLYESEGFRGTCPEQGYGGMAQFFGDATWEHVLAGPPGEVCPVAWRHFAGALALFSAPGPEQLRSVHLESVGPRLVERTFVEVMQRAMRSEKPPALVLPGPGPRVLGFAVVGDHPVWGESGTRKVLDFYVHPSARAGAPALLDEMLRAWPEPLECYCDSRSQDKVAVLRQFGFRQESISPSALRFGDNACDLLVLVRA
jgi:GNAT superfamily N-acetyltransferase